MALPIRISETHISQESLFERLEAKEAKMAVIGLGQAGLPLALQMASKFKVIGYDINKERIAQIQHKKDPSKSLSFTNFKDKDFHPTGMSKLLELAQFYIVAIPTPVNENNTLNLIPLKKATATVARNLRQGDIVVFENSGHSGCIENILVPILEQISGLKYKEDFKVGYTPRRTTSKEKMISGCDPTALKVISKIYASVLKQDIQKTYSLTVAETIKATEDRQQGVNTINFMVTKISAALKHKKPSQKRHTILVKGITSHKNTNNIQNSKAAELSITLLKEGYNVVVQDNHVYPSKVKAHYDIELCTSTNRHFDAIILAVDHDNYKRLTYQDYLKNARIDTVFFDIRGNKKDVFPTNVYVAL